MDDDQKLNPPLQVWKLAILLLSTATLYQFVWLYRTMVDVRAARALSVTPWHWALIPLLGPFAVIPGQKLATYLKDWQIDDDREIGYFAEPVMVGMFILMAYLPLMMLIVDGTQVPAVLLISMLLLCLTYLILQGQLNRLKEPSDDPNYRSPSWRYVTHQIWSMGLGCLIAVPLYIVIFTSIRENWYAATLMPDEIVSLDNGFYRLRIQDAGWSRAADTDMTEDADLNFFGPDDWTWAVVYDSSGQTIDAVLSFRTASIREDFSSATCTQKKTVVETGWVVQGDLECSGRTPIEGDYIFTSRVLRKDQRVVEVLASTSQRSPDRFAEQSGHVRRFVTGVEMIP